MNQTSHITACFNAVQSYNSISGIRFPPDTAQIPSLSKGHSAFQDPVMCKIKQTQTRTNLFLFQFRDAKSLHPNVQVEKDLCKSGCITVKKQQSSPD